MEQDAVHIGYEADVTAHLLDTNGKKVAVTTLLDTGAVGSVIPINVGKDESHQVRTDTDELKIGSHQSRSHLPGCENSHNSPPDGRTEPLVEFFPGGEPG